MHCCTEFRKQLTLEGKNEPGDNPLGCAVEENGQFSSGVHTTHLRSNGTSRTGLELTLEHLAARPFGQLRISAKSATASSPASSSSVVARAFLKGVYIAGWLRVALERA